MPAALLIAAATVVRRYHYTADAALGLVVAVVCWAGSRFDEEGRGRDKRLSLRQSDRRLL